MASSKLEIWWLGARRIIPAVFGVLAMFAGYAYCLLKWEVATFCTLISAVFVWLLIILPYQYGSHKKRLAALAEQEAHNGIQ